MEIRLAGKEDLPEILEIYAYAREQMRKNGNPTQWGNDRPLLAAIIEDLEKERMYLILSEGLICGVFVFYIGDDPTYQIIKNGAWLNDLPYGVIHKVASNDRAGGILSAALTFAEKRTNNLKMDTHRDNRIMQRLLERNGFIKCGIIYTDDGTERIAYQRFGGDFH